VAAKQSSLFLIGRFWPKIRIDTGATQGLAAMRFMMLMIPTGYEKAAPGTMPDAKAVEAGASPR